MLTICIGLECSMRRVYFWIRSRLQLFNIGGYIYIYIIYIYIKALRVLRGAENVPDSSFEAQ